MISYASRALADREKGYSTTEKVALVIAFATDHFHTYLLGKKFTVIMDDSWFRSLHSLEPKGRLSHGAMNLQEYEFDVVHRSVSENGNADGLSRITLSYRGTFKVTDTGQLSTICATSFKTSCNLQAAKKEDACLKVVIKIFRDVKAPIICLASLSHFNGTLALLGFFAHCHLYSC